MNRKLLAYFLPFFLILSSCSNDNDGEKNKEGKEGESEKTELSFVVNFPNKYETATYALLPADENAVDAISVLAFRSKSGTMQLAEWATADPSSIQDVGIDSKKKFIIKFNKLIKGALYQFVVVANAQKEVDALFNQQGITVGAEKESTLSLLKVTGITKWVSEKAELNYRNIPMWGEGDEITLTDNMNMGDIKLLRMTAKISITVDANTGVRSDFKLKEAYLYNNYRDGRVSPSGSNLEFGSKSKVKSPTQVGTYTKGPIQYISTSETELLSTIYTFESKVPRDAQNKADLDKVTCLVVGGTYQGSAEMRYYRLDIVRKSGIVLNYLDILRNYNYKVNITKVRTNGYLTPGEAFDSRLVDIEADVLVWDDYSLELEIDEKNHLWVDKNELVLYMSGDAVPMKIFSNHLDNWRVEDADKDIWLTVSPSAGVIVADTTDVAVTATAMLPTDPYRREGSFVITTGNLKKKIMVVQLNGEQVALDVTPDIIVFRKTPMAAKSFVASSYPVNLTRSVTTTGNIVWATAPLATMTPGASDIVTTHSMLPVENNTGTVLTSTIVVKVQKGSLSSTKTIEVRQLPTNLMFEVTGPLYPAVGGTQNLQVKSETPWMLSSTDPPVVSYQTAEQPSTAGAAVNFPFVLAPNPTFVQRNFKFTSSSSHPEFVGQVHPFKQAFNPMYLKLNGTNADVTLDFGLTTAAKTLKVNTNAGNWKSTIPAVSSVTPNIAWAQLITSWTPGLGGTTTASTSALVDKETTITVSALGTYVGIPYIGGTKISTKVPITSGAHAGATAITRNVIVTRTVPSVFKYIKMSPIHTSDVKRISPVVSLFVDANVDWYYKVKNPATTKEFTFPKVAAIPYPGAATQKNITIETNTTWSRRSMDIHISRNNTAWSHVAYFFQPGYNISSVTHNKGGATLSRAGTNAQRAVRVTVNGDFTAVNTQLVSGGVGQVAGTVPASTTTSFFDLVTPASEHWGNRVIYVQYKHPNKAPYENIGATVNQAGYAVTGYTHNVPGTIPAVGGSFLSTLYGDFPQVAMRVQDVTNNVTLASGGYFPAGTQSNCTPAIVPPNTGVGAPASRIVQIEYLHPINGWTATTSNWQAGAAYDIKYEGSYNLGTIAADRAKDIVLRFSTINGTPALSVRESSRRASGTGDWHYSYYTLPATPPHPTNPGQPNHFEYVIQWGAQSNITMYSHYLYCDQIAGRDYFARYNRGGQEW